MDKLIENESLFEAENLNENDEYGSIFFCESCQEIPEFIFDEFPIIKVICKKANKIHEQQLFYDINNISKEECQKNHDNILKKFSNILLMAFNYQNNNDKSNDKEQKNLEKLKNEEINKLKNLRLICHEHELPFKYYCNECGKHQCKECRLQDLSNEKCEHKNCVDFIQIECDIKDQIKEIEEQLEPSNLNNKSVDSYFSDTLKKSEDFRAFKKFVDILINHYKKYRHNTIIKNITNLYSMLSKGKKEKEKKYYEMDATKVFSPFRLSPKDNEKITEIKFSGFCVNMQIFEQELDLSNLIKLSLKNNNINDISILTNFKFDNLEKLNLNSNQLGDDMIDKIAEIKASNLKNLNLSFNYFTDFKLFKAIEHFKCLEIFKMETNPFNEDVDIKKINDQYNFCAMKKLYLSNGIFCNETIGLLTKFLFSHLEVLDISSNNIESLKFFYNLQFINEENKKMANNDIPLKEIYLNNGDITNNELDCFSQFPNLEKIELKNNLIEKYDTLKGIRSYLANNNKCRIIAWENPIENL